MVSGTSYISLHGASWSIVWGALLGVMLWAIITSVLEKGWHRALALIGGLLFLGLYSASNHREAEEFRNATPVEKGQIEEAAETP